MVGKLHAVVACHCKIVHLTSIYGNDVLDNIKMAPVAGHVKGIQSILHVRRSTHTVTICTITVYTYIHN